MSGGRAGKETEMKIYSGKNLAGISLGAVIAVLALSPVEAGVASFGHAAEIRAQSALPVSEVAARRKRVVRRNAAAAGAIIGAAIIGGAIIANSQRRARYYDDGYYYYGPGGYVTEPPHVYYGGGPAYYYGHGAPQIIHTPDKETPYTYAPAPNYYYGQPVYRHYRRTPMRDPAGGGVMR